MGICHSDSKNKLHKNNETTHSNKLKQYSSNANINGGIEKEGTDNYYLSDPNTIRGNKEIIKIGDQKKSNLFLPHLSNSLSKDDIEFYKTLIEVKKKEQFFQKAIFSFDDLKSYLNYHNQINKQEEERAKIILCWKLFNWITENIKYENILRDDNYDLTSSESIFTNRTSSSLGIAKLVHSIFQSFAFDSIIISGYLKGFNFHKGSEFSHNNHEWNAVMLFGTYRLIDCASACVNSPYSNESNAYNENNLLKNREYFLFPPAHHLIYTHFPHKVEYTFLNHGNVLMDKILFENLPHFKKWYFIYGFQLFDYKTGEVDFLNILIRNSTDLSYLNEFSVTFCLPEGIIPFLELKFNHNKNNYHEEEISKLVYVKKRKFNKDSDKKKINMVDYYFIYEDILSNSQNYENISFLLDKLEVYEVSIRLPTKEMYELQVSACKNIPNKNISKSSSDYCFSYYFNSDCENNFKEISIKELMFPLTSDIFISKKCHIIEPLFYNLNNFFERKKNINFLIKIPDATNAAIFYDGQDEFVLMNKREDKDKENNLWFFSHSIEKEFNTLVIAASFGDSMVYSILVTYTI